MSDADRHVAAESLEREQVIWRSGYETARRELSEEHAHIYSAGFRSGLDAGQKAA